MTSGARRARGTPGGFTLVEVLVAIVLFAVVTGAVTSMLLNVQRSWTNSRNQMISGQNERAGVDLMVRDIRMAGTGFAGRPITTGGVPGNTLYPLQPRPGAGDADTLTITGGFTGLHTATTANMGSASDALIVADVTGFEVDDFVVITNGVEANMFQVTAVDAVTRNLAHAESSPYNVPAGHVIWPSGGYPAGATVVQVDRVSYWVDVSGPVNRLMRKAGEEAPLAVAAGIDGMRLVYICADGSQSASPEDPSLVRSVLLEYLSPAAQGACGEGEIPSDTLSLRIQPRVLG